MYKFYLRDGYDNDKLHLITEFDSFDDAISYVEDFVKNKLKRALYCFNYYTNPKDEKETIVKFGSFLNDIRIIRAY